MEKSIARLRNLLCGSLLLVCATVNAQTNQVSPRAGLETRSQTEANAHDLQSVGNFGTHNFTVEFWMNAATSQNAVLVGKRDICNLGPAWNIIMGYINGAEYPGNIGFEIITWDADYSAAVTAINISDGQWHHIALTRAGTIVSMYIDGLKMAAITIPATVDLNNSAPFQIGRTVCEGAADIQPYQGQINDLAIYNRALTDWEIMSIYNPADYVGTGNRHNSRTSQQPLGWLEHNERVHHRQLIPRKR